jgi:nucleotide sugar dehydrogenase
MPRTVAVVGLGKIGLPLAAQFATKGVNVIGCDVLKSVVDAVNRGESHIKEEPGLADAISAAVANGRLHATEDTAAATSQSDTVVVIVPLMVDAARALDFRSLDAALEAVGRGLHRDTLVIIETTLPVGTTRNRIAPLLEKASGLHAGTDFSLAFSPERLYAGRIFEDLRKYPKIVGGIEEASTARAVEFYMSVLDAELMPVQNPETAEFAKLAETTYRDTNIALANQLALYGASRGVNVREAFRAANTQPFSHLHSASIGVGGHCIPVYPHFLLQDASDDEIGLVRMGRATNDSMAELALGMLGDALGGLGGRRVLVLGASYREDVKELAFSTAIPIVERLHNAGARVLVADPLFTPAELAGLEAEVVDMAKNPNIAVDAVIVQAMHRQFRDLDWKRFRDLQVVFDGRAALDPQTIRDAGANYLAVGLPSVR